MYVHISRICIYFKHHIVRIIIYIHNIRINEILTYISIVYTKTEARFNLRLLIFEIIINIYKLEIIIPIIIISRANSDPFQGVLDLVSMLNFKLIINNPKQKIDEIMGIEYFKK